MAASKPTQLFVIVLLPGRSFANLPDSLKETSEMPRAACHPLTLADIRKGRLLSLATTHNNHLKPYLQRQFIIRIGIKRSTDRGGEQISCLAFRRRFRTLLFTLASVQIALNSYM
ncbi:MAG: hypothetical protein IKR92_03380 [Alphaproteobacteria bacterium]|nr:hypothetical protein [Alphaproteobacteria bacterium]